MNLGLPEVVHTRESALRAGLEGLDLAIALVGGQPLPGARNPQLYAVAYALIVMGEGLWHYDRLTGGQRRLFAREKKIRNYLAHNPIGWMAAKDIWGYPTSSQASATRQQITAALARH